MSEGKASKETQGTNSRRYGLMVLALILLSVFSYNTYSYFTDSTKVGDTIELSTGSVKLGDAATEGWQYQPLNDHVNTLGEAGGKKLVLDEVYDLDSFSNLRPGDRFVKNITVEYVGTLEADALVVFNKPDNAGTYFEVNAYLDNESLTEKIMTVTKGDTFNVQLSIELPINEELAETPDTARNLVASTWSTGVLTDLVEIKVVQSNVEAFGDLKPAP